MTDRELLELAAKAAGFDGQWGEWPGMEDRHGISCGFWIDDMSAYWNPLQDDGDALRLAVKLGLIVDFLGAMAIRSDRKRRGHNDWIYGDEDLEFDDDEANRRAIVRAAAEIGRAMP